MPVGALDLLLLLFLVVQSTVLFGGRDHVLGTAGLTLAEASTPLALIRRMREQGLTFVLVEHVMPIVMDIADRIIVINFGRKVAEGSPQQIVDDQAVRDAYFGETIDAAH